MVYIEIEIVSIEEKSGRHTIARAVSEVRTALRRLTFLVDLDRARSPRGNKRNELEPLPVSRREIGEHSNQDPTAIPDQSR
jgi:hypothetical protein